MSEKSERYFGKDISVHGATDDLFWFSHITQEYEVTGGGPIKQFRIDRSQPPIKLDWDNCTVNIATILPDGRIRFVIRSKTNRNSDYMGNIPVQLRFMLGVDTSADAISEIRTEKYHIDRNTKRSSLRSLEFVQREEEHERWVFALGSGAEVWQWVDKNQDLRSSPIYRLREEIRKFLDSPPQNDLGKKIFRVQADKLEEVVPVIYQPAIDSLDNFLREVHCHVKKNQDGSIDVEVSLLFNNEYLRRFWFIDHGYRWFRKLKYGRLIDIETFHIHFVRDKLDGNYFLFENIYSGSHTLEDDTVHLDAGRRVEHEIAYYLADQFHPIVFINTSNHAMAEHDTNHQLWKWEYIPWIKGAPVKRGSKSRRGLDSEYKTIFDWLMQIFGSKS